MHGRQPCCLGTDPGVPTVVGDPGGAGKAQSEKASSIVLMLSLLLHRHAASIEINCNHVNLLTNHDSTDGEDELLGNALFMA